MGFCDPAPCKESSPQQAPVTPMINQALQGPFGSFSERKQALKTSHRPPYTESSRQQTVRSLLIRDQALNRPLGSPYKESNPQRFLVLSIIYDNFGRFYYQKKISLT